MLTVGLISFRNLLNRKTSDKHRHCIHMSVNRMYQINYARVGYVPNPLHILLHGTGRYILISNVGIVY